MEKAFQQHLESCVASRNKGNFDAWLGHIVARLQVCRQYLAAEKTYMLQSGARVFVVFGDYPRQRLQSYFKNAPFNEDDEEPADGTEAESQTARHSAVVRERFECHCGSVKAHIAVFALPMRAGSRNWDVLLW